MPAHSLTARAKQGVVRGTAAWLAKLLCLASAPSFALMALFSAISGSGDPICTAGGPGFHAGSMGMMYLLMGVFHLPPWLRKLQLLP